MKKEKVLFACSGGPDSMALLNMYKNKKQAYVCHINYHKRPTANRDEKIVRQYCKKWKIPFYKYDYDSKKKGNFQKLARDFRYDCFKEVCDKNNIKVVYVAHQMDDHIETYLMQVKRNTNSNYYGISKKIIINGLKIYRPIINKTKKQIMKYLDKNKINYGIDESNYTNQYERNRVRHNLVDKMTRIEKLEIVSEIKKKNEELKKEITFTKDFINSYIKFPSNKFCNFKYFDRLIRTLLYSDLSGKHIKEIRKAICSKNNIELKIKNKILCKEYGYIYVYDIPENYSYEIKNTASKSYDYFKISNNGDSRDGAFINKTDFPLIIRNYRDGDSIKLPYGTKKINRFFIDNKISSFDRKIWPIVLNKKGETILVPGIGCNVTHYSKKYNIYVLKF